MTDERVPPHDLNAEKSVLGAMMLAENAIPDVFDLIGEAEPFDDRGRKGLNGAFWRPAHQMIYAAIMSVHDRNETPDPVLVAAELDKRGETTRTGGAPYLFELYNGVPLAINAKSYAETVVEKAAARRALEYGVNIQAAAYESRLGRVRELVEEWQEGDRAATGTEGPGRSWQPMNLRAVLDGTVPKVEPTIGLIRADGLALLYPGKEHSILGEMESGKSWFSTASCAAELLKGEYVVYIHFEECDPTDTVERLRVLGVPDAVILERFRFVGPLEPVRPQFLAALLDPAPSLVILDGVNEAMALHGQAIREEDGAAAFRRVLVKPCTAVGAAVLTCDHVVKDRETRGRYGLGSVHKGNAINGSLIMLESAEPFGRGQRGRSNVFITKDRPGQLRQHGKPTKLAGKTFMGSLVVDDTRTTYSYLDLTFWAPSPDDDTDDTAATGDRPSSAVADAVAKLDQAGIDIALGRDKVRTAAARKNIALPGNTILSKAISFRRERASRAADLSQQPVPAALWTGQEEPDK